MARLCRGDLELAQLDLRGLKRVLEINPVDRVVHAEAGILGPDLDAALRPHGLTVREVPSQSPYPDRGWGRWNVSSYAELRNQSRVE